MRTRWHGEVIAFIDCLLALTVVLLALTVLVEPTKKADANTVQPPGAMPQDLQLFDTTVARNIARFGADAAPETIVAAAKLADAHAGGDPAGCCLVHGPA